MAEKYVHRNDAPFGESVWEKIDEAVVGAAKSQLTGRRLLHIEGPYGLGLTSIPEGDTSAAEKPVSKDITLRVSRAVPLVLIQSTFCLPVRDIASFERTGMPINTETIVTASIDCARQEDALIFNGSKELEVKGLLAASGIQTMKLKSWDTIGAAADDIIQAVTNLDDAGYHGPYTLALAPKLYNLLYRRYPQGNATEIEHIREVVTDGVIKAPALSGGGVLMASGMRYASIVVGQDLMAGFTGPSGGDYEFMISESVALRLRQPAAICALK
jgi:uncharacterized linocin/CFP29 family protein